MPADRRHRTVKGGDHQIRSPLAVRQDRRHRMTGKHEDVPQSMGGIVGFGDDVDHPVHRVGENDEIVVALGGEVRADLIQKPRHLDQGLGRVVVTV